MTALNLNQIQGTWTLEAFEIESTEKVVRPWGLNARGLLIYSPTGHMSVSINKDIESDPSQSECENTFDSVLFYSGTYAIDGEIIRHQVTNASNPSRIGREMIRYANFDKDLMTLITPQESFGRALLKWRKVQ